MSFLKESIQEQKLLDQIPGYEEIMTDLGKLILWIKLETI